VDARHRARARCENWIKKLKNAGLGKLPFTSFAAKRAWALNLTAPPAWLQVAAPKRARRDRGPHPRRGRERPRPAAGPREGPIRKGLRRRLQERGVDFTAGIRTAALDSFRGYTNAIRDELPEALTVLDAFHVVKLGSAVVDEVRRRIQQDTLGRRGRKGDPLFRGPCRSAPNPSPTKKPPGSMPSSPPGTRTARSPAPGSATRNSATSTTPASPAASTGSGAYSRPTATAPTGPNRSTMPKCEEPLYQRFFSHLDPTQISDSHQQEGETDTESQVD
jgi:hypothetical protein